VKRPLLLSLAALAITLATPAGVRAAVVTVNPSADAFVTTGPTNNLTANNYGGGGALGISATGSPNGEFQSVLKFDTSTAKSVFDSLYGVGAWHAQSVLLQLTATPPNNAIFNSNTSGSFTLSWMQNDGWTEGTGTPNAPGATGISYTTLQTTFINPGADELLATFNYDGSSSGSVVYSANAPPGLAADLLAGGTVSLRASVAAGATSYLFNSRSATAVANRPLLSITAVPEPGLAALLGLGAVLAAVRRRAIRRL
jgi:hypothetical protein